MKIGKTGKEAILFHTNRTITKD
ncbi:unnamed protein product [Larinioides sclopetarius]|uniref:Uncharacterized protein n=1 Tax=Larinioides sclopetarius TaxID=280406 RepID=A0AAV2B7H9_9ARAC